MAHGPSGDKGRDAHLKVRRGPADGGGRAARRDGGGRDGREGKDSNRSEGEHLEERRVELEGLDCRQGQRETGSVNRNVGRGDDASSSP